MYKDRFTLVNEGVEIKFEVDLRWNGYENKWSGSCYTVYEKDSNKFRDQIGDFKHTRKGKVIRLCNNRIKSYIVRTKENIWLEQVRQENEKLASERNNKLYFVNGKLTDKV